MTAATIAAQPAAALSLIRDAEIEATLKKLTTPIFRAADLPPESVPLFIINDDSLNAFVSGGGRTMFFHTGLLRNLPEAKELMGVVAHETGHITAGHIVRRIEAIKNAQRKAIIATILGIGAGVASGSSGVGAGAVGLGNRIVRRDLLKFTRTQEAGADQLALQYLNRAGVDPSGLLTVLERLERENGLFLGAIDPYALTHPLSDRRIQLLRDGVAKSPALGKKLPKDLIYWHTRMRAKLDGFLGGISDASPGYGGEEFELYRKAIALHRYPSPDRALATVDKLIKLRPKDPYYWELKGEILAKSGRGAKAIAPYRRALSLAPHEALIAGGLGEALLTADSKAANAEALRVLEKAAIRDPFHPRLKRALALAYARAGRKGMAALATAERLVLLGRVGEAKAQARRAKAALPTGSPGWLRADDVLSLKGGR